MKDLCFVYNEFANTGLEGIVPFISKCSSRESLVQEILSLHIDKIADLILVIKKQKTTENELFNLLEKFPYQLKFSKQLCKYREDPKMNLVFLHCVNITKSLFLTLTPIRIIKLKDSEYFNSIWMTLVESWCSELDVNNLTAKHMKNISEETAEIIIKLNKH